MDGGEDNKANSVSHLGDSLDKQAVIEEGAVVNVRDLFLVNFILKKPSQHTLHLGGPLEEELHRGG